MTTRYIEQATRLQAPVQEEPFQRWNFPDGSLWTLFYRQGTGYRLRFPDLADFEVSADGSMVQCWPVPGVTSPTVEHLYLNQVLPLALSRQGKRVLHGSAVDIEGQGVAFLGESGRGKSTLAAAFAAEGASFLTDDGLLLEWVDGRYMIVPSHPSIRLWEDSQMALIRADVALAPAVSFTSKSRLLAGPGIAFCEFPRPLSCVFFLGDHDSKYPEIEAVRPADALIELVKNSFLLDTEARELLTRHFDDLALLAKLPIFYRLDYPRNFDALPALRQVIIRHIVEQKEKAN